MAKSKHIILRDGTPKVASPQQKFVKAIAKMSNALIERDDEILLAMAGLAARQHVLFVGPPGTAKSLVATTIQKWITDSNEFTLHCNKDTTRNVAFGPIKVSQLVKDVTERNLAGGAADCHVLIMEEVFKSGPAVLDMFLMLLNERVYREGLVRKDCPLRWALGVSNEWSPEGCEAALSAFFDRFILRKEVRPIATRKGLEKLCRIPYVGELTVDRSHETNFDASECVSLQEIDLAFEEVKRMQFTKDCGEKFFELHGELAKVGVVPGDRRLKNAIQSVQGYAYVQGAKEVDVQHLEVLKDVLWNDPNQAGKVAQVVAKVANPNRLAIGNIMATAYGVVSSTDTSPTDKVEKLKNLERDLACLIDTPQLRLAQDELADMVKTAYRESIGMAAPKGARS